MKKTISLVLILVSALVVQIANADFVIGTPTNIGTFSYTSPSVSADGLWLFTDSLRPGGHGDYDIWVSMRKTVHDDWSEPVNPGPPVNGPSLDGNPDISADGLMLFFDSDRAGGHGGRDMWLSTRTTINEPWSEPVNLGSTINGPSFDAQPSISTDGLSLFFSSDRAGGHGDRDTWLSTRATTDDPWSVPVNLGPVINSSASDSGPDISADGVTLFFDSGRPGGYGGRDIWLTRLAATDGTWSAPVNLGPIVNTLYRDITPSISADGYTLYFWSNRPYGRLMQVPIEPLIDFNGDGVVNSADMCAIVNHWGEDYPLCDIGPTPFGDGIVDVEDLVVLSEHLFEQVNDPTLIAHWALDETEGMATHESVSGSDDVVMGNPLWQPSGGQVDGALELDGVDACVISSAGPNPADGPFSVFAWIKGGAPGQVIISQPAGANWLMTDQEGRLMTELGMIARVGPLLSDVVITDGQWYRIGFVWDGTCRALYVDDILVAEDTVNGLGASGGGLYIGVEKDYPAGTFFSGLIDDVRIYNRAVKP